MVGLMERIAHQLAERVATLINIRTIFRRPAAEAMRRITEAQAMLEKWQLSYMKARPRRPHVRRTCAAALQALIGVVPAGSCAAIQSAVRSVCLGASSALAALVNEAAAAAAAMQPHSCAGAEQDRGVWCGQSVGV